ncbi:MAG: homocysteine S-methyltransferase family protein [Pseudomonadota bacterium]
MTSQSALLARYGDLMLAHAGIETDLIFNKGVDLPGFASFPLMETAEGRALLETSMAELLDVGARAGTGVILESPTWMANRDRAAGIGYAPADVLRINRDALAMMAGLRDRAPRVSGKTGGPIILSGNIGPRDDAYAPADQMSAETAEAYHAEQIAALAQTEVDVISAYTLAYPAEAIGIVRAARAVGLPVVISFTVETDGTLPTGQPLGAAIAEVDAATAGQAAYFMINCAHPDHFGDTLEPAPWMDRLRGLIVNASRCSHAELDEAEHLDDGDPVELGQQMAALRQRFPHLTVLGGCCGTDMRHMAEIAQAARALPVA